MVNDHVDELSVLPQEEEPKDEVYDFLNFAEIPTPVQMLDDSTSPRQPTTVLASPSCFFRSPVRSGQSSRKSDAESGHTMRKGSIAHTPSGLSKKPTKLEIKTPEALCWTGSSVSPARLALTKNDLDDELRGEPSSGTTPADSFFSFLHPFSPLETADDFENGLLPLRLSPLLPITSSEMPRLIPPFPFPKLGESPCNSDSNKTPSRERDLSSSPSPELNNSFPRIQASTRATPGQEERSKLSTSARTMKLQFSEHSEAFPKREMQFINSSLKRKCQSRKRKITGPNDSGYHRVGTSNVQRKLLQTPQKRNAVASPRSSLHPFSMNRSVNLHNLTDTAPNDDAFGSSPKRGADRSSSDPLLQRNSSVSSSSTPVKTPTSLSTTPYEAPGAAISPLSEVTVVKRSSGCNCKKSKCLKLYCECFARGGYCDENCRCIDCANTKSNEDLRQQAMKQRLEKNPNAFKPKIESACFETTHKTTVAFNASVPVNPDRAHGRGLMSNSLVTAGGPAPGNQVKKMHKHGCHCKKSACRKKYCECFQAGVPCGDNCRCIECRNQPASAQVPTPFSPTEQEMFVSPLGVRRLRIDRETWARNFSSPFEFSPRHTQERERQFRLKLKSVRAFAKSASVGTGNSQLTRQILTTPERAETKSMSRPVKATSKAQLVHLSLDSGSIPRSKEKHLLVYPLFGDSLPPLKGEVCALILQCLSNSDLYNASLVNHLWSRMTLGDSVWDHENFILRDDV